MATFDVALADASTDTIRAAVDDAAIPPLLCAVAFVTGDAGLIADEFRPVAGDLFDPQGGLMPPHLDTARDVAAQAIDAWRAAGAGDPPDTSHGRLQELMEFVIGGPLPDADRYLPMLEEELSATGTDLRDPTWTVDDLAPGRSVTVAIIGAGMSGLLAAHRLREAGVDVVVLEKNDDVGGTWLENQYPGCRVDVPNHLFSYSFAQRHDWPAHFSPQAELLDYFRDCAERFDLRSAIRFRTEVQCAEWDDEMLRWTITTSGPDGPATVHADAVISAVGQLNRPKLPDIEGRDDFAGISFHSSRWDHDVDLAGKRAAVIGTAASAAQLIPIVADQAEHVTVFQRTPNWLVPTPDYHADVPAGMQWLLAEVPSYAQWLRLWQFWRLAEGLLPMVEVDPTWDGMPHTVSEANDQLRQLLALYLDAEFGDRPDLHTKVVPKYPPGAKRILRDNGVWARTLKRDDVSLVTDEIERIVPEGVLARDGTLHETDVLVYATGFQASRFLTPMTVRGRSGVDLHQRWDGTARAHLGVTIPGFPNFFCLYGPNTNIVVNGSIIYFSECEVRYVLECLRLLLTEGVAAIDCRQDVHDAYNSRIDAGNLAKAWGVSDVNSWYKNESGHISQNWPFTLIEFWEQTRAVDPADYELLRHAPATASA